MNSELLFGLLLLLDELSQFNLQLTHFGTFISNFILNINMVNKINYR